MADEDRPGGSGWTIPTLKTLLESMITQNDQRYQERFRAAEIATSTALAAQERAVSAAFAASDRAIVKAEEAQKEYNARSNEFRGQLDDQAKGFPQRTEMEARFAAVEDKLSVLHIALEDKIHAQQGVFDKRMDGLTTDIVGLRESRSESAGRHIGTSELLAYLIAIGAIVAGVLSHYLH